MTNREKWLTLLLGVIIIVVAIYYLFGVKDGIDLLVALGTIGMTLIITYIEIIKSWIRKPDTAVDDLFDGLAA